MYCASESVSWRTEVNGHSERRRNHGNMDGKDDKSSRDKRLSNADSIPLIQFDIIYIMYILQRWVLWRSEEVGHSERRSSHGNMNGNDDKSNGEKKTLIVHLSFETNSLKVAKCPTSSDLHKTHL